MEKMDSKNITGLILIALLFTGWLFWQQYTYEEPEPQAKTTQTEQKESDTSTSDKQEIPSEQAEEEDTTLASDPETQEREAISKEMIKYGPSFVKFAKGEDKVITIENEVFIAEISTKGAAVKSWTLKNFNKWDGVPVQLINNSQGEFFINFVTFEGNKIDSRELYHTYKGSEESIKLKGDEKATIEFVMEIENGKSIVKTFTFSGDKYSFVSDIQINNLDDYIPKRGYNLIWQSGLKYQEYNTVEESQEAVAIASLNGSIAEFDADDVGEIVETSETGIIDYAATKIKYFTVGIIPQPFRAYDGTVDITATKKAVKHSGQVESYELSFRMPYQGGERSNKFEVFIGPLDYDIVKPYGLEATVNLGWRIGIRQIGEYFILPIFRFIHSFVGNWGITLMLFGLLMKLLLYPLSIQQMKSAQKMQLLTPEMNKIREKYKDDQQKQQREIMNLYSTYGVNPASGCFPLLLQMPILFALYAVLRNSIDLRQSDFIWWITDLSRPDILIDFGVSILGISHISGLALAMGVTMFFQQKLTVTDPRQKSLIYMMPFMFTFMFSFFPAGLNLYYFVFNLLSVGQQIYLNKFSKSRPTLEDLRKSPKKEGWLQRKMREAQDMAEQQGKTTPGSDGGSSGRTASGRQLNYKNPNHRKKKK